MTTIRSSSPITLSLMSALICSPRMTRRDMSSSAATMGVDRDFVETTVDDEGSECSRESKDKSKGDQAKSLDGENDFGKGQSFFGGDGNETQVPHGMKEVTVNHEKPKTVKSVSLQNQRRLVIQGESQKGAGLVGNPRFKERKDVKVYPEYTRSVILESKVNKLEHRINMLEGELRKAAAIESTLHSVVAEHGISMSKVHAPARCLSRLYLHACGEIFGSKRASAVRSIVSGLVLVAKARGNDVPRSACHRIASITC